MSSNKICLYCGDELDGTLNKDFFEWIGKRTGFVCRDCLKDVRKHS